MRAPARTPCHAVAGRDRGVGRLAKHLPGAAGRQQRRAAREPRAAVAVRVENADADARAVAHEQIGDERVLDDAMTRGAADAAPQHAPDLAAGGVARVQHAADAVGRLAASARRPSGVAIEAPRPRRAARARSAAPSSTSTRTALVAQAVAGGQRVLGVQLRRVVGARPRRRCRPARSRYCPRRAPPW